VQVALLSAVWRADQAEAAQDPDGGVGQRDHSPNYLLQRLFLIFAASSACASANVRTIALANAANALGVAAVTEDF
jgi:hypothetical protein